MPTEAELAALYSSLRRRYFWAGDGRGCLLPPAGEVAIEWSTRLTASAGVCYPGKRLIRLSTHYHRRFPDEVESTLLHEMIHLIVPGHGPAFRAWIERIRSLGGSVNRFAREPARPPRWVYVCPSCGSRFPRQRRLPGGGRRYRCRACGPGAGPLQERGPLPPRA